MIVDGFSDMEKSDAKTQPATVTPTTRKSSRHVFEAHSKGRGGCLVMVSNRNCFVIIDFMFSDATMSIAFGEQHTYRAN